MQVHEFTLYDMFVRNAFLYGDRPAVIHPQGHLTFGDFLGRVDALAAGLAALPLHKGERVCILALNHPSYLELYGACARLGVIAYPLNWRLTTEEIKRHFNVVAESLRSEIRAVAESQAATNERLDHLEAHLEARIVEESSETRAMIRLSFGELDRRIRSLEENVTSLRSRLEKLEARA